MKGRVGERRRSGAEEKKKGTRTSPVPPLAPRWS